MKKLNLEFSQQAWQEYVSWQSEDKKTLKRINKLIDAILREPFEGIGKPEPLKFGLSGAWSRRIDDTNRLVYIVTIDKIQIVQVKYHY
ncbi:MULTISPECIES: Txe/YoeB family addiction module toxin [Kurthia]|uniref:Txe/YoeB family addiction module toxin n=1 Tax=Kurthia TaxID=1649 RepID=UPI00254B7D13|nr:MULTISPECIES: Txe/YoeB family addiction module toxin [Kurthia]MEB6113535.1 Txe/YoeB family addiction module toxin [Kurthia gibsonii]WIL38440.1 Txe/YoeB family addiction module toxin [Kurthia sp. YJT4]